MKAKITRKNTKNEDEVSAIDFVIANSTVKKWISRIKIDKGLLKIKGKHDTDHTTICITLNIHNIDKMKVEKRTEWNVNAPSEKSNTKPKEAKGNTNSNR